ncbi:MAG: carboxypeptidase regulatory-like domain-containing protein [Dysgonomonas sp.]|nr:carboxypeptidase regulatory-like domain-containing protein [Dysgonomonas sp.]
MIKYIFIIILFLYSLTLSAQIIHFEGIVRETLSDSIIHGAKVRVFTFPNKNYITETQTNKNGLFELSLPENEYIFQITSQKNYVPLIRKIHIHKESSTAPTIREFRMVSLDKPAKKSVKQNFIRISGIVKDSRESTPLSNISVEIINPKTRAILKKYTTLSDGAFTFLLPKQPYLLRISSPEYSPVTKRIIPGKDYSPINVPTIYLQQSHQDNNKTNIKTDTEKQNSQPFNPITESPIISQLNKDVTTVNGIIIDETTQEPVSYAPVRVSDHSNKIIASTASNQSGRFSLSLPNKGTYSLNVKLLGYKSLSKEIEISNNAQKDTLILNIVPDAILLSEAVVTARIPKVQVKGDTLEYWAGAYTKDKAYLLQDLLKNIPGINISQDGILTIHNKPVNKILIDGKEFFGNDIQIALKNIPSEIINKLHVYKEQSDIADLTGIKDLSDNQVIDLELKNEFKQNTFGNLQMGYGSDSRYYNKFMVNRLSEKKQFTILGNMNNVNNDEHGTGADSDGPGLKTSKTAGINFNWEKERNLKIENNITYDDNTDFIKSIGNTESILSTGNRYTNDLSSDKENNKTSRLESNLEWKARPNLSIYLKVRASHEDIKNDQQNELKSYVSQQDTTTEQSHYSSIGYKNRLSGTLILGYKLNEKGRNLTFQLNGGADNSNEEGINKSQTIYSNLSEKVLDQKLFSKNRSSDWGGSLSYTEPLSDNNILYLSYTFNRDNSKRDKNVFNADDHNIYSITDSTYTRQYKDISSSQIIGLGFQSTKDKYEYLFNLSIEPTNNKSSIYLRDSMLEDIEQKSTNYNSSFRISYKPKKNIRMNFAYSGILNNPNTVQLSTDTTTLNTLNKTYGNPSLKASLSNNLGLQYQQSDFETGRFFMVSTNINFITNQIAEYSTIDTNGNTETTYKNVNGNWGSDIGFIFSSPLKNEKFTVDNNTNLAYYRNTGFINDEKNIINSFNLRQYLSVNFDSKDIKSSLQLEGNLSTTKNNLSDFSNKKIINYSISNSTYLELPYDISLNNHIGYKYYIGYSNRANKSELLWSISLSKLLLREKGELRFHIYDILNQKKNIIRVQKTNKISDITTNSIKRYFLLSFLYRFNINN